MDRIEITAYPWSRDVTQAAVSNLRNAEALAVDFDRDLEYKPRDFSNHNLEGVALK